MIENLSAVQDQLYEMINYKKWSELQEAWLEIIESVPQPLNFHKIISGRLIRKRHFEWLETLYKDILEEYYRREQDEPLVEVARMILEQKTDAAFAVPPLCKAFLRIHKDRPAERIMDFLEKSGLKTATQNIPAAIARFDDLLGVQKGQVFRHPKWGLGIITLLDTDAGKVTMDFPNRPGQVFTIMGVREFLEAIPTRHFISEMIRRPEETLRRMKEEPGEILKFILRSFNGSIKAGELKKVVMEKLLNDAGWKEWWAAARDAIRLDPWIEMNGAGAHAELKLRKEPRSFAQEILERMAKAQSAEEYREALREMRHAADDAPLAPEQAAQVAAQLRRAIAQAPASEPHIALSLGYLWEEFAEFLPGSLDSGEWSEAALLDVPNGCKTAKKTILALDRFEHQTRAIEGLRRLAPSQWAAIAGAIIPSAPPRFVTWLERLLASAGEEDIRHRSLEEILNEPARNPEAFLWLFRRILDGEAPGIGDGVPRAMLFGELLDLLNAQQAIQEAGGKDAAEAKALGSRLRSFAGETNFLYLRKVAKEGTPEEARKLLSQMLLHNALPDNMKAGAEAILISAHPDLRRQTRAEAEEESRKPAFHYTTAASLEAQRTKLSHILNVEIPENSKAIGVARDHGDLRENAEYHAAKERQKLLHQQAEELNDLIIRARVIEPEQIKTESAGFGTHVQARETETGKVHSWTLMGIWEAKPEQGIISYLTPLGNSFLNARAGAVVEATLNERRVALEIISIEKAMS